jgi:hypothetical protein
MERRPTPQDISWFLDLEKRKQLDLDPPYQRKSVWTRTDKQYFLDTIFNNYPCPAIFLHKTISDDGETVYHVVDGKQRLQTILEFVRDEIAIPKDFVDTRIAGNKWSQIDPESRKRFWNYLLTVEMLPAVEEAVVNSVFERINRNARKLTRQELRHAKFEGWLASRAEVEAEKKEWRDFGIVTTARAKRMADVQFIAEVIILTIRREIIGFDQDVLDKFYAEYDAPAETAPTFSEDDFDEKFEGMKTFLAAMNQHNARVRDYEKTLAHFYSLWGYLLLAKPAEVVPAAVADNYLSFMTDVTVVLEGRNDGAPPDHEGARDQAIMKYAVNVRGANTDAGPRRERHDALATVLNG